MKKSRLKWLKGIAVLIAIPVLYFVWMWSRFVIAVYWDAVMIWIGIKTTKQAPIGKNGQKSMMAAMRREGIAPSWYNYLVALSAVETGNWSGNLYRKTFNLFSMKKPTVRDRDQSGFIVADGGNFATFKNLDQSIRDVKLWFDYHGIDLEMANPFVGIGSFVSFIHSKNWLPESGRASHRKAIQEKFSSL